MRVASILLSLALFGCSPAPDPMPAPSSAVNDADKDAPAAQGQEPWADLPTVAPGHTDADSGTARTADAPTLDQQSAVAVAVKGIQIFVSHDHDQKKWWQKLAPYMSDAAVHAYESTDPQEVPATKITGEAKLLRTVSPKLARVSVPTDAGVWLVILSQGDKEWLIDRIYFQELE